MSLWARGESGPPVEAVKLAGQVGAMLQACTLGLVLLWSTTLLHQHVFVVSCGQPRLGVASGHCRQPGRLHDDFRRRVSEEFVRSAAGVEQSSSVAEAAVVQYRSGLSMQPSLCVCVM